jgi:hypothetical protein
MKPFVDVLERDPLDDATQFALGAISGVQMPAALCHAYGRKDSTRVGEPDSAFVGLPPGTDPRAPVTRRDRVPV